MSTSRFETYFPVYLDQAKQAHDQNQHHDYRRQLFLSFLDKTFQIDQSAIN